MIDFFLNGQAVSVDVESELRLLAVLRNELGALGCRFGCGEAQCGSCTVLVNGATVRACVIPVRSVAGKHVTTLEGIGTPANPHPIQQAFIDEQAMQCGYCVSGIIMTVYALLENVAEPTEGQIRQALDAHICRCGTHARIIRAVKTAISFKKNQNAESQKISN